MGLLDGKVAIVTGSSRGIGKAIALELASQGAAVTVCGRTERPTEDIPGSVAESAEAIRLAGGRVLALRTDLAIESDLKTLVDATEAEFGRIDILVNNAALWSESAAFLGGSPSLLDRSFLTNLRAPYVLSQIVAPKMAANGGGAIINVSSGAARNPLPPSQASQGERRPGRMPLEYGISKAALDRFSTGLAAELAGQNIAVITLYPGFTMTEIIEKTRPGADFSRAERPEVSAKAVAFLCRDPMRFTGQILSSRDLIQAKEP